MPAHAIRPAAPSAWPELPPSAQNGWHQARPKPRVCRPTFPRSWGGMVYRDAMPTNKLWIEHTERAAWDSVEALRERLLKAESRLQALAAGIDQVPRLLDLLDEAKQRYAPDAQGHDGIVTQLLARIERLQAELD